MTGKLQRPASAVITDEWFARPPPANVVAGEGSWIHSAYAFLHCRSRREPAVAIGRSSGIYSGTMFELGPEGEVAIGDYCALVGVVFATNRRVRIGDYCFLAHEVVIADTPFATPGAARGPDLGAAPAADTCVALADDVWIGAGAILLDGARIGRGAIVGAAAVVDFEVPDYAIVAGNPARVMGFVRPLAGAGGIR